METEKLYRIAAGGYIFNGKVLAVGKMITITDGTMIFSDGAKCSCGVIYINESKISSCRTICDKK